jgi:hypothetical protein
MIDFPQLLRLLTEHDVAFLIIGVIHGSSRLTQDLDVVYQRSLQNLTRLVQALAEQSPYLRGAPPGLPFQWSVATLRMGLRIPRISATQTTGKLPRTPREACHPIHRKVATQSTRSLPPSPGEAGPRRSSATLGTLALLSWDSVCQLARSVG